MNTLIKAFDYATSNIDDLLAALQQHLWLGLIPLVIGLVIGLPLGLWSARSRLASTVFINGFNALRAIPSLAILLLAISYFGLSF